MLLDTWHCGHGVHNWLLVFKSYLTTDVGRSAKRSTVHARGTVGTLQPPDSTDGSEVYWPVENGVVTDWGIMEAVRHYTLNTIIYAKLLISW